MPRLASDHSHINVGNNQVTRHRFLFNATQRLNAQQALDLGQFDLGQSVFIRLGPMPDLGQFELGQFELGQFELVQSCVCVCACGVLVVCLWCACGVLCVCCVCCVCLCVLSVSTP